MDKYTMYIYLIFAIKIIFIVLALANKYFIAKKKTNTPIAISVSYWKARVDFIFTILMAGLLVYLFYPQQNIPSVIISGETKLLMFLFGVILIITANWSSFFTEAIWFQDLQQIISQR